MIQSPDNAEILIIDDDPMSALLATIYLKKRYASEYVTQPQSVMGLLKTKHYRMILLDIDLGAGIRGEELLKKIRGMDHYSDVPVIAMTGYSGTHEQQNILQSGFNAYLAKPYTREQLLFLIDGFLK